MTGCRETGKGRNTATGKALPRGAHGNCAARGDWLSCGRRPMRKQLLVETETRRSTMPPASSNDGSGSDADAGDESGSASQADDGPGEEEEEETTQG